MTDLTSQPTVRVPFDFERTSKTEKGMHSLRMGPNRRQFSTMALALTAMPFATNASSPKSYNGLPSEVAGIKIPGSSLARAAASLSRKACPDYLFNHCMRTYLFGALAVQRRNLVFNADEAFAAAALHDLGLLPAFESPSLSFEIDGANAAEKFVLSSGLGPNQADIVWHAVALHAGRFALAKREGPEAMLVALGAGSDVDGPELETEDERNQMAEIVAAFPRLQFKRQLTSLLIAHCKRKPISQRGTWLEGLCREQVPSAWTDTVEQEIASSPFTE